MSIAAHIGLVTKVGGNNIAIEFEGRTVTWRDLGDAIGVLGRQLTNADVGVDDLVGLLGRNRLEPVTAFIATLGADRPLLLVNAVRPAALVAEELRELGLACLIGAASDLSPQILDAASVAGTMVLEVSVESGAVDFHVRSTKGSGPFRTRSVGTLIEIQTSGTTGKPKRISVAEHTIEASLRDGVRTAKGAVAQHELVPRSSPTLMFSPLVHTSGTFNTLMSVFEVRPIVLFEKFDAEVFRHTLVHYQPKFVPLPPPAIRMMVDSDATRDDFASVKAVRAGTAPLPVELQIAFEEKFGVPVLTTYGATEFMGVVTSWTLDDHSRFGASKRGSVGRASKGVEIRVADQQTGVPRAADEVGLLEARLQRIDGGKNWIRTTDLARIDEDGFLYILGRADDAIIRGGFKVMAGKVADVIRQYPGVHDAIVVGRPDVRLGEVPVAVIEARLPNIALDEPSLKAFAKERLTPYEVPVRFHVVAQLPRTVSDKISRVEVKNLLDALET